MQDGGLDESRSRHVPGLRPAKAAGGRRKMTPGGGRQTRPGRESEAGPGRLSLSRLAFWGKIEEEEKRVQGERERREREKREDEPQDRLMPSCKGSSATKGPWAGVE